MKKAIILIMMFTAALSQAAIITVSQDGGGDYTTIQVAIDAAIDGDEVVVFDGTYTGDGNRDIDFLGKAITVRSANGPEKCIINCEENGRGFLFNNGEDRDSVLSGVSIEGARAVTGAAVYCYRSNPTITNCIMTGNTIVPSGTSWALGAGVYSRNGSPLISHCKIFDNTIFGKSQGGGIYARSGGINIIDCFISGHKPLGSDDYSGGIRIESSNEVVVRGCIITNNAGRNSGGIGVHHSTGIIDNCIVAGNAALNYDNSWEGIGGGIGVVDGDITIANCTIVDNVARRHAAGVLAWYDTKVNIYNCIIWGNISLSGDEAKDIGKSENVNVRNCNVENNLFGSANISEEPLFAEPGYWGSDDYINELYHLGDYHLQESSPCIDTGDNSVLTVATDIDGNPRIVDGDCDGTAVVDMGAYEFIHPVEVSIDIKPHSWPNPVNVKSKGVLPVVILGSEVFDVNDIDVGSIRLESIAPIRSSLEDTLTLIADPNEPECTTVGPDGYMDLLLKFETKEIIAILGEVIDGEEWMLSLTGNLYDGTGIEGTDCIIIRKKGVTE